MINKISVTVLVPAYNEKKSLEATVEGALRVLRDIETDYEIIIIDDGSNDGTSQIADNIAGKNKRIQVIHHTINLGFGQSIRDGIHKSSKEYITGLPGDNDTSPQLIVDFLKTRKDADLVIAYMDNPNERSYLRRFFSHSFVQLMNLLFGLKLRYYNSYFICKTNLLKKTKLVSQGFTIFAEAKVRLIKKGVSYKEIPFKHVRRIHGDSKAVSGKSIINSLQMMFVLMHDIYTH